MTYYQAISKIIKLAPKNPTSINRDNFKTILNKFGNPQNNIQYIHITGTNGKGSVALKIAKILQLSNMKTGLYTSPHLHSFTQRIKINNQPILRQEFSEIFWRISSLKDFYKLELNFFQVLTLLSFIYYNEKKVDIVSLEVGMGGKHDCTNVIIPLLSVITSIGLDHTQVLGNTIQQIALEKAGIIKPYVPVVIGKYCQPYEIFIKKSSQLNSPLYIINSAPQQDFNIENNEIVKQSMEVLKSQNKNFEKLISQENILTGIQANQQCRMQYLKKQKHKDKIINRFQTIVFDVAHNPPAIEKLCLNLKKEFPNKNIIFAYGASSHKDVSSILKILNSNAKKIYIMRANHFRSAPLDMFLSNFEQNKNMVIEEGNIRKTIDYILKNEKESDLLVICGSFYLMSEAKGYFQPKILQNSDHFINN